MKGGKDGRDMTSPPAHSRPGLPERVISGGQTGVDRAALDAAMESGIPAGGFCPKGRRAEDGKIPAGYPLTETLSRTYRVRTEMNVVEADATLVLAAGRLTGGTRLTVEFAQKHGRPFLVVLLDRHGEPGPGDAAAWIRANRVRTLNVAGPRESTVEGGIHARALRFLRELLGPH